MNDRNHVEPAEEFQRGISYVSVKQSTCKAPLNPKHQHLNTC